MNAQKWEEDVNKISSQNKKKKRVVAFLALDNAFESDSMICKKANSHG